MKKVDFLSKQQAKHIQVDEQLKQKTHLYIQQQTEKKKTKRKTRYLILFPTVCVLLLALTFQSPITKDKEQPISVMEQRTKEMPIATQTQLYENNEICVWLNGVITEEKQTIFHLSIEKLAGNPIKLTISPSTGTLSFENKDEMKNISLENGMSISYSYSIKVAEQKNKKKAFTISLNEKKIIPFQTEYTNDGWVLSPY